MASVRVGALILCVLIGQLTISHQVPVKRSNKNKFNTPIFNNLGNIGNGNVQIITDDDGTETINDTNLSLNNTNFANFGNIGNGKTMFISNNKHKGPIGIHNNFGNIGNNNLMITKQGAKSWLPWNQDWDLDWD